MTEPASPLYAVRHIDLRKAIVSTDLFYASLSSLLRKSSLFLVFTPSRARH